MSKFKVGDAVIVVKKIREDTPRQYGVGSIGVVTESKQDCSWGRAYFNGYVEDVYWDDVVIYTKKETERTAEQLREEILRTGTLIEKSKKDIEEAENKREALIEQLREKGFLLYEKDSVGHCVTSFSVDDVHVGDHLILAGNSRNYLIRQGRIVSVEVNDKSDLPFKVRCLSTGNRDWVKPEDVKRA